MSYKLGSLFDGSGGFPLAGALCGVEPCWASEVEPYPIAVTRERFPNVKHLGDISKINGGEIEPVDIITFGSPCQDLSVAGKRAGLKHEANGDEETTRSGLFMEAVRIIKEMRAATNGKYPRFALWENVPGAFSSNKGEDFRIVCEELIKIVEPRASMPEVPKNGWAYADSYVGDGWSLAYRVFDAQYWGVPQRRRRIHLVADFRGECAREVLFEREGVRGYFAQGRTPWQTAPADAQGCTGADDREGESGGGLLIPSDSGHPDGLLGGRGLDAVAYTMKERAGCAGGGKGPLVQEDKSATLATSNDQYFFQPVTHTAILDNIGGQAEYGYESLVNGTLRAGAQGAVAYVIENHPADSRVNIDESGKVQTLTSRMGTGGGNVPLVMEPAPDANFIDVEMEVAVRKYKVDTALLCECLRDHKVEAGFSNKEIAEQLNRPITEVEHWFRADKCFAIPAPEIWFKLKSLLGIATTEFDESIMVFEYKGGTYDMRNRIHTGDTAPTLTCGCGNDLHLLPEEPVVFDGSNVTSPVNASNPQPGDPCHTLSTDSRNYAVICLQGNGIDRADTAGCNGKGWKEDTSYTLNTIDRPAVVYAMDRASFNQGQNAKYDFEITDSGVNSTIVARGPGAVAYPVLHASKASFFTRGAEGAADTLVATDYKDPQLVVYPAELHEFIADHNADAPHQQDQLQAADGIARPLVAATHGAASHHTKTVIYDPPRYIVRRLTPTECARLQGFADCWGHVEKKDSLTDEEYSFWLEVRNTHAAINGKKVQDYTEKQMLTWYNKLWTDSAEYKMWGNGIALPPALYCLQGIVDALNKPEESDDEWML